MILGPDRRQPPTTLRVRYDTRTTCTETVAPAGFKTITYSATLHPTTQLSQPTPLSAPYPADSIFIPEVQVVVKSSCYKAYNQNGEGAKPKAHLSNIILSAYTDQTGQAKKVLTKTPRAQEA